MTWILGKLAKFFTRLHYRYEVRPFAIKEGHARAEVREVVAIAVQRIFDEAWPDDARALEGGDHADTP